MAVEKGFLIHISQDEREHIITTARERGFSDADEYLLTLVEADAEEDTAALEASFKRAWKDAKQGKLLTEEEFWKALQDGGSNK